MLSFTAQPGAEIPSYLFTSPDASLHVFDFLSDSLFGKSFGGDGTSGGSVLNWTDYCSGSGVFLGYGPFLGCLLYPNVTRNVRGGTLPANLTELGYSLANNTADRLSPWLRSSIPTCLVSYCASQPDCASTFDCDVGKLFTDGRDLSAHGVATCWQTLCSLDVQALNADIAGIGILISYLVQSVVALLGLTILAMLACFASYYSRKALASPDGSGAADGYRLRLDRARRHWAIIVAALSEFHKAQCYLAIALQAAAFVLIFTDLDSTSYNDQNLLLLVGLDGLIPIVLSLYTLMTFGRKSWYMIILSVITVVMASVQGAYITHHVLLPQPDGASSVTAAGGHWPLACSNIGPSALCSGMGPNEVGFDDDAAAFDAIMAVMVTITALLVLWKISTDSTTIWSSLSGCLATRLSGKVDGDARYRRSLQIAKRAVRIFFHSIILVGSLGCLLVEFYYFNLLFTSPLVNFRDWSFGQIVGITTWAGVFVDFAYLEYSGIEEASRWRLPKWLHVEDDSRAEASAATQLSTIGPADDTNWIQSQLHTLRTKASTDNTILGT